MVESVTPRRGRILKHVVEEYVITAQPVSSDTLVKKYVPFVSSATVRNELAVLEDLGYLYHPHTSSGRVPSDAGYRYYIDTLMPGADLPDTEKRMISHQFHQVELDVHEWLRLAASVLSSRIHNPVIVAPPLADVNRLRNVSLMRIGPASVLFAVMLRSGAVRQQVVRLTDDISSDVLTQLANEWNEIAAGKSAVELRQLARGRPDAALLEHVAHTLMEADRQQLENVHVEGLSYIAAQPEFGTSDRFQPVVETIEAHRALSSLIEPLLECEGVFVAIGQEQRLEGLRECAVVLAAYGQPGELIGMVGVLGPTRMPYWRAVPMVEFIAAMLDRLLEDTYLIN
jgi:heat-inducible transcriptional repressor